MNSKSVTGFHLWHKIDVLYVSILKWGTFIQSEWLRGQKMGRSSRGEPAAGSNPEPAMWPCQPHNSFKPQSFFHLQMMWLQNINDPLKITKGYLFKLLKEQYGSGDGNRNFKESDGSLDLAPVEKGKVSWPRRCERIDLGCLGALWEQDSLVSVCREMWLFWNSSQQICFSYVMSTMV